MKRLPSPVPAPFAYGAALIAVTLAAYAGTYVLWLSGHQDTYLAIVRFWGIDAWAKPFLDLAAVLSWGECHHLGYDVYRINPCDPLGRPVGYGPVLTVLPLSVRDTMAIGIAQGLAFLAALPLVVRPRNLEEWLAALAASLSTATLFALERGNLDLFEFVLLALAGLLAARVRRGRYGSYALYYLGGTLKFYPFALLLLLLRERPGITLLLGLLFAGAIGLYAVAYWPQLVLVKANLPGIDYNTDTFGALVLPFGIADEFDLSSGFRLCAVLALFAGFGSLALYLSGRLMRVGNLPDWSSANSLFLLTGAIVLTGCFAAQANLDYRGIYFLFMLPGLFDLRNRPGDDGLKLVLGTAIWALLFCMWGEFFRRFLEWHLFPSAPDFLVQTFFVSRELVWWGVMSVAMAVVLVFVRTSPLADAITGHTYWRNIAP